MRHTTSINVGLPLPTPTTHRKRKKPPKSELSRPLHTAAGQITIGTFATLAAARAYLAPIRSGTIAPLSPPHLATSRALVEAPNAATLANILKNKA